MAAYNEEVLIRPLVGEQTLPVRLHDYLTKNPGKTELLNRIGCSAVKITDGTCEEIGGSGFLAKFRLVDNDEFYALVTNEHVIGIDFVRTGRRLYISSELLQFKQDRYQFQVTLSACPFAFCSPRKFSSEDEKRIRSNLSSNGVPLTFPTIAKYEGAGPYLDVTVVELNDELVNQIGTENFITIDHLTKKAAIGEKTFVLQYPEFPNAVSGATRYLCISCGVVSNYLGGHWSDFFFVHKIDTLKFASGSPVLRWNGTVCGVHSGGETRQDRTGKPDDYNVAATMNVLIERLKAVRPQKP